VPAGTAKVGLLLELVPLFEEEELLIQVTCPHELLALSKKHNKTTAEKQDRCRREKFLNAICPQLVEAMKSVKKPTTVYLIHD
jgi:hypothetical protein